MTQPATAAGKSRRKAPSTSDAHDAIRGLGRLAEVFQLRRVQLAQSVGLTDQQWGVLEEISTEHFMPSMFARRRDSTPAAVSKIIRQLVDKGLIRVSVSKGDARQRDYILTAKGRRVIEQLRSAREDAVDTVWMGFDRRTLAEFTEFATELAMRLEQYATRVS